MVKKLMKHTIEDVIQTVKKRAEEAEELHKTNSGMCQHCGKHKAEYPEGNPNPYHCSECNAHTRDILAQLRGPGFLEIRGGQR